MIVRKLRLQRGWSQEHLAELAGVIDLFGPNWERRQIEKRLGRKL